MSREIYLDHAAATPILPQVVQAMLPYFSEKFYNPSAPYLPAVEIRRDYERAKTTVAQIIGTKADQLIMTAGATESINLAFSSAQSVIISGVEHPAVVKTAEVCKSVNIAPVNSQGIIDLDQLVRLITPETDLVSVCLASSDLGTIQPLRQVAELIKKIRLERAQAGNQTPLLFHSDASQGLGYLELNAGRSGADLITISAAKIGGPKQVAALWVRPGVKLSPVVIGGGQELGLRGGTENIAGVIGFAAAVKEIATGKSRQIAKLRDKFEQRLADLIPDIKFLGAAKKRLPNYSVILIPNLEAERLIYRLEARGVLVSTGAACAANRGSGSLALQSIGLTETEQGSSLRITLGGQVNLTSIMAAADIIAEEIKLERERVDATFN